MNQLHHARARTSQQGRLQRVRAVWAYRAWRRTSRYYLARLWLGLGSLERLRREWTDNTLRFRRTSDEENLEALVTIDAYGEVALVEQLDLALLESAIEHAEDRLGNSVLAAATVGGGGVAGAVVAALLSTGSGVTPAAGDTAAPVVSRTAGREQVQETTMDRVSQRYI